MIRPCSQVNFYFLICAWKDWAHTDSAKGTEVTPSSQKVTSTSQVKYDLDGSMSSMTWNGAEEQVLVNSWDTTCMPLCVLEYSVYHFLTGERVANHSTCTNAESNRITITFNFRPFRV